MELKSNHSSALEWCSGHMKFYLGVNPLDRHVSWAHDMAFTRNFLVVYDCSVVFSPEAMMNKGPYNYTVHWVRLGSLQNSLNVLKGRV